jgi:hypothetical protein
MHIIFFFLEHAGELCIFVLREDMHIIFMSTYWTQCWSILQTERDRQSMKWACRVLDIAGHSGNVDLRQVWLAVF